MSRISGGLRNENVRMERNIPIDVKAKVREITSAIMKTTKKGLGAFIRTSWYGVGCCKRNSGYENRKNGAILTCTH